MSDREELTDIQLEEVKKMMAQFGVAIEEFHRAIVDFFNQPETQNLLSEMIAIFGPIADLIEDEERQRAHERSKADRRRKSRKWKYKWGGTIDE